MPQFDIYEIVESEKFFIDSIEESHLKEWLKNEGQDFEHLKFIKESGHFIEMIAFEETDWDVINRGIDYSFLIEKRKIFKNIFKTSNINKKIKRMTKDKPLDQRKHHLKTSRGTNRKRQNYVPLYRQIEHGNILPTAQNVLKNAKKSSSGVWRISGRQVAELAQKYKFNPPDEKKRSKHLGSTGILMWRKSPKEYYLVKFSKHYLPRRR